MLFKKQNRNRVVRMIVFHHVGAVNVLYCFSYIDQIVHTFGSEYSLARRGDARFFVGTCGGEQRPESPPVGWAEWGSAVLTHGAGLPVQLVRRYTHVGGWRLGQWVSVVAEEWQCRARMRRTQSHLTGLKHKINESIIFVKSKR